MENKSETVTLYWHDYETFGVNPAKDRPSQFAGIRTDLELNPIGKPLMAYCRPPSDYLPNAKACLITGITPQQAQYKGECEAEFIGKIYQELNHPGTCTIGYNNIRFDDEVTRHTLYRNFYDPYEREWKNGNSRWDLLDIVRACYALRPEGITWVYDEHGLPSFRLELLTKANGISHNQAHDALSDVEATIAMANIIKQAQPRLFDYLFKNRGKKAVSAQLDVITMTPVVHVSGMLGATRGCVSWMSPITWHPINRNAVVMVDLDKDITPLLELSAEQISDRLYTRKIDLEPGQEPIPIKLLHTNKCPVVAPAKTLSAERALELGIDPKRCRDNLNLLRQHPEIREKITAVFSKENDKKASSDPELQLYSGGFFSPADRKLIEMVRQAKPEQLATVPFRFEDDRLPEMLFRYRARNFPQTLNQEEQQKWQIHCQEYLEVQLPQLVQELEQLLEENQTDEKCISILKEIYDYIS